jgi:hypothetical protein
MNGDMDIHYVHELIVCKLVLGLVSPVSWETHDKVNPEVQPIGGVQIGASDQPIRAKSHPTTI